MEHSTPEQVCQEINGIGEFNRTNETEYVIIFPHGGRTFFIKNPKYTKDHKRTRMYDQIVRIIQTKMDVYDID